MAKSVSDIVQDAADAGQEVVVSFIDATDDAAEWFIDAAALLARAGEGAVSDVLRPVAKALGATRYTVKVRWASKAGR